MDATVQTLFESGVAPSTASAYRSGVRRYRSFRTETGLSAFPLTETVVCRFVAHLHQAQLSLSSIRLYLSAIRFSQIAYDNGNPHLETFDRLHYVVRGVARTQPRSRCTSRLPITVEILQHLLRAWSSHSSHYEAVMLWAACTLGFFAFLRAGEFIAGESNGHSVLTPADVRVDSRENPSFLAITLRDSKTDPYGIGHVLYVGRTGSPICPVAAMLSFLAIRPPMAGPLFIHVDSSPLTRARLIAAVRSALESLGVDIARYSGHSFTIGAATAAAQVGLPDSLIQTLGRWRSSAYLRYIRTPRSSLLAVSRTLLNQPPSEECELDS